MDRSTTTFLDLFSTANRYLPWIIVAGLALGIANYSLGFWPTIGQSIFQQVAISLVIGYGMFVAIGLSGAFDSGKYITLLLLGLMFTILGILGSEVDTFIDKAVFANGKYAPFTSYGKYLFNIILSNMLGFATYYWTAQRAPIPIDTTVEIASTSGLSELPIKQGEVISMHALNEVMYFESYDNYAFLFNMKGERILANNSLLELEKKLGSDFLRVHRKYLINKRLIHQIRPHVKSRYTIYFKDKKKSSVQSSASYSETIRGIIKI